jgi:Galactose mutarotase-like
MAHRPRQRARVCINNVGLCDSYTGVPDKEVEPYRMYNLDVFEYLAESNFGLYGSVPLLMALKPGVAVGAFWCDCVCISDRCSYWTTT